MNREITMTNESIQDALGYRTWTVSTTATRRAHASTPQKPMPKAPCLWCFSTLGALPFSIHHSSLITHHLSVISSDAPHRPNFPWITFAIIVFAGVLLHSFYKLYRRRVDMERALALESEGRLDEAIAIFSQAARKDKHDAISMFHLGLCWELQGDMDRARDAYQKVVDDPRCDFAAKVRIIEIGLGRPLDRTKLNALDFFERGVALLARGDVADALDSFTEGAALHPAYRPVQYYLGVCAEINGRPHQAIGHYERLLDEEKDPTLANHRILAVRANKLWQPGDAKTAIRLRKGWNYLQVEMFDRAAYEFGSLLRDTPDEYTAYFGLARCNIANGDIEAARDCYREVPEDDVRHADAQAKLHELGEQKEPPEPQIGT